MNQPSRRTDRSLAPRVIVGVVFAPLVLWLFWNGGYPFFAFLALLTLFGQWELFSMAGEDLSLVHRAIGYLAGLGIVTDAFLAGSVHITGILAAALILLFSVEIAVDGIDRLKRVTFAFLATAYPAVFMSYLIQIGQFPHSILGGDNRFLLVYLIGVVWIFDTASYFSGMNFGRHPFFPKVSPKKTVEGFLGGIAGVMAFGAVVAMVTGYSAAHLIAVAFLAGISGQAGDLSESIIKRELGIKDSSNIIPGHGGILDRFDSVFFAAPVVYGYLVLCSLWCGGGA